jgi:hypothetical protein
VLELDVSVCLIAHKESETFSFPGQVILLLTISQSESPSWPKAPNYDPWPYFSLEENFCIVFRGATTLRGERGCHVQG